MRTICSFRFDLIRGGIWQFDCYIIPKKNVITNVCLGSDDILMWGMQNISLENIDFLEKQKSWSSKISQYGKEDETCIEFLYEKDFLRRNV